MTNPADFLLARIAEDEEFAATMREVGEIFATSATPDQKASMLGLLGDVVSDPRVPVLAARMAESGVMPPTDLARVLAECDAKRRIVEQYRDAQGSEFPDFEGGYLSASEDAVRLLALPYADHPDWREEWRP